MALHRSILSLSSGPSRMEKSDLGMGRRLVVPRFPRSLKNRVSDLTNADSGNLRTSRRFFFQLRPANQLLLNTEGTPRLPRVKPSKDPRRGPWSDLTKGSLPGRRRGALAPGAFSGSMQNSPCKSFNRLTSAIACQKLARLPAEAHYKAFSTNSPNYSEKPQVRHILTR